MSTPLESAIPPHLRRGDRPPRHPAGTYRPANAAYTARFSPETTAVVMASFGLQSPLGGAEPPEVRGRLIDAFALEGGPGFHEEARYVDGRDHPTWIATAYWDDRDAFARWHRAHGQWWTDPRVDTAGGGRFLEVSAPSIDRVETLHSSPRPDGVAHTATHLSGAIEEHGYWGAMRDRLPAARASALESTGTAVVREQGGVREVLIPRNWCLIRSSNDIGDATDEERESFLRDVAPALHDGMRFLQDEGATIGCIDSRHMVVLDRDGAETGKGFGMSWWRDLAALEAWATSHPTHVRIFGAAMRYLTAFGERATLRLSHEVCVLDHEQSRFQYLDCHDQTGLLRATP